MRDFNNYITVVNCNIKYYAMAFNFRKLMESTDLPESPEASFQALR